VAASLLSEVRAHSRINWRVHEITLVFSCTCQVPGVNPRQFPVRRHRLSRPGRHSTMRTRSAGRRYPHGRCHGLLRQERWNITVPPRFSEEMVDLPNLESKTKRRLCRDEIQNRTFGTHKNSDRQPPCEGKGGNCTGTYLLPYHRLINDTGTRDFRYHSRMVRGPGYE